MLTSPQELGAASELATQVYMPTSDQEALARENNWFKFSDNRMSRPERQSLRRYDGSGMRGRSLLISLSGDFSPFSASVMPHLAAPNLRELGNFGLGRKFCVRWT